MARRFWTEEEINYLEKKWGVSSISLIAKRLKRTPDSVSSKAHKLGLQSVSNSVHGIPMAMLPEIVGRPYGTVRKTWANAGLKVKKCGKEIAYVQEKDLYKFMQEHPNLWDARECDYYYFYTQKWFLEALENERNGNHAARYKKWSEEDKAKFIYLREQKSWYFRELADEFGITHKNAWKTYQRFKRQREEILNGKNE